MFIFALFTSFAGKHHKIPHIRILVRQRYTYILFWMTGLLFSFHLYSANTNEDHLSRLQILIQNNLAYDTNLPADSVILWQKQLEPELKEKHDYILELQLKHLVIEAYIASGNMSLALNDARMMYEQAKKMNHPIGLAFACRAIGDVYFGSARYPEAIESYKEAVDLLEKMPDTNEYTIQALAKFVVILLKAQQPDSAFPYLKRLEDLCRTIPEAPITFYQTGCYAYYYIQKKEKDRALPYIQKTQALCQRYPHHYYQTLTYYIYAIYHLAEKNYPAALEQYDRLLNHIASSTSYRRIQILQERANLLARMGRTEEACRSYENINTLKDSLDAQQYVQQINELHTLYQIDQKEIENQQQRKKLTHRSIAGALLLLLLIVFFIIRIRKENQCLLASQQALEKAKIQEENSIRTKSIFLSNMSHEIRTPLNALSGFSSILTDECVDNETRQQCNSIIQQNSELLLKLINDVIDLSNLELGQLSFVLKEQDAVEICRNVIDMVEKIKQTQAEVRFVTTLKSLPLRTDSSRLQQLLINLLINATKFTPEGSIVLELKKQTEDMAIFSVTDTGCGIPPEQQAKIFNRFEKLNENAQGTGLGLSICQLIIQQMGGEIWIDPQYTGGSRFLFTHPVCATCQGKEEKQ